MDFVQDFHKLEYGSEERLIHIFLRQAKQMTEIERPWRKAALQTKKMHMMQA